MWLSPGGNWREKREQDRNRRGWPWKKPNGWKMRGEWQDMACIMASISCCLSNATNGICCLYVLYVCGHTNCLLMLCACFTWLLPQCQAGSWEEAGHDQAPTGRKGHCCTAVSEDTCSNSQSARGLPCPWGRGRLTACIHSPGGGSCERPVEYTHPLQSPHGRGAQCGA